MNIEQKVRTKLCTFINTQRHLQIIWIDVPETVVKYQSGIKEASCISWLKASLNKQKNFEYVQKLASLFWKMFYGIKKTKQNYN